MNIYLNRVALFISTITIHFPFLEDLFFVQNRPKLCIWVFSSLFFFFFSFLLFIPVESPICVRVWNLPFCIQCTYIDVHIICVDSVNLLLLLLQAGIDVRIETILFWLCRLQWCRICIWDEERNEKEYYDYENISSAFYF